MIVAKLCFALLVSLRYAIFSEIKMTINRTLYPHGLKLIFQPIEEKFAKRVSPENASKYFMLNSVETITKTSSSLICEVFLEMLISQKEATLLSGAIDAVYFSGITVSSSFVLSLFQDDEMLFQKGKELRILNLEDYFKPIRFSFWDENYS